MGCGQFPYPVSSFWTKRCSGYLQPSSWTCLGGNATVYRGSRRGHSGRIFTPPRTEVPSHAACLPGSWRRHQVRLCSLYTISSKGNPKTIHEIHLLGRWCTRLVPPIESCLLCQAISIQPLKEVKVLWICCSQEGFRVDHKTDHPLSFVKYPVKHQNTKYLSTLHVQEWNQWNRKGSPTTRTQFPRLINAESSGVRPPGITWLHPPSHYEGASLEASSAELRPPLKPMSCVDNYLACLMTTPIRWERGRGPGPQWG